MKRIGQVAPGVWTSDQGISGRDLPAPSGMPVGPRRVRSGRFRSAANGEPIANVFDESQWAELNGEIVIPVGLASLLVLPGPSSLRNLLGFRNSSNASTSIIRVAFGGTATLNSWLILNQNEMILFDSRIPQDDVYAICADAAGLLTIVQSTTPGAS